MTSLPQAEGRVTQPDAPSRQENRPSLLISHQPCTCWDLPAGVDSVQSPGVPSTGYPGAFFLLSQMPAGVAIFQTELITAVIPPVVHVALKALQNSLHTRRDLA